MYKVVLFDVDGTIADTDVMIVASFLEMIDLYRPDYKPSLKELVYISGPPITETLAKFFPNHDPAFMLKEYQTRSKKYYERYVQSFPDARATLVALKDQGIRLGLITSKMHAATLATLRLIGLDDLFELIIALDDVTLPKPHPEGILRAIDYFKVAREDVLYVGDTVTDDETSDRAGVDGCLVTWTLRTLPQNTKAKYRIDCFPQLMEVIKHE